MGTGKLKTVAVIIVNWNGSKFLARCLSALARQTVRPNRVIVVDNASSDGSSEIVGMHTEIELLALDHNAGFARANNIAIASLPDTIEWVALLNPDAFVEPRWLETLLLTTVDYPDFDAFSSKLLYAFNPNVLDGAGDAYHIIGRVWRVGHGKAVSSFPDEVREVFSPCAAAALYRRSALLEVGGFDEDYFCYVEDVDLGFRLRLAGYRCLYVPSSVAKHIGSGTTGGQHSNFALYHGHRNLVWTYVKDMPGMLFWAFLPLHLAMNLVALLIFTLRGHGAVMLRAKRDAVLGLPKMWAKRRQIQSNRVIPWHTVLRAMEKGLR